MEQPFEERRVRERRIQEDVFEAITSGKAKMRSRWYFWSQTILIIVGSVILALFVIYLIGFMIFLLRQSGVWFAPGLGFAGWYIFFRSLPWLLILLSLIFILVLTLLVNRYAFIYHRPLLYSLLGIIIIVTAISFLIALTPFNTTFLDYGNPMLLGGYYGNYGAGELADVHRGEVSVLASNGFVLQGLSGETSTVLFSPQIPTSVASGLRAGDLVVVFGNRDVNGFIQASAIEKIQ